MHICTTIKAALLLKLKKSRMGSLYGRECLGIILGDKEWFKMDHDSVYSLCKLLEIDLIF